MPPPPAADATRWTRRPAHRAWLRAQAERLFDFFQRDALHPRGGFRTLDDSGAPLRLHGEARALHITARAAHCYAAAMLLGRPGAAAVVDHAMDSLARRHRDPVHGGYIWSFDDDGPRDAAKRGYGHAFVLLAAASATLVGHPLAASTLADVAEILEKRFWEEERGAIREEFTADWTPTDLAYRGQNANMHLCEALMAAFEATGERQFLDKAERIADLIIRRAAGALDWRVPEHFDAEWRCDPHYRCADQQFRPTGTTPGHWLEWARLLLQLHALGGARLDWAPAAARGLFAQAMRLGWDGRHGGFFYTLDWSDLPDKREKLWWPACEGVGAAHFLAEQTGEARYEADYRRIWDVIAARHLDQAQGGWFEELTEDLQRSKKLFPGKADIYHAVQACLIPLYPATGSLTRGIIAENAAAAGVQ